AFKLFVDSAQDSVVKCLVDSPSIFLKKLNRDIDLVQATATFSKSRDKLTVHLVNLSENDDAVCKIQLKGFKPKKAVFRYVSGKSLDDKNTFDNPNNIIIEEDKAKIENDAIEIELRRHSVASVLIEGLTQ
ncbi:MAG: alpha-L-arabinofuranosidase C-terminal domain-containing protein, partial [Candidatus Bathyarchaeia archaeon]